MAITVKNKCMWKTNKFTLLTVLHISYQPAMKWYLLPKSWESELLPYLNMKVWHIGVNPEQKVQLTLLHHKVLQVKIIFRLNFLNLLCLLALKIHELLGLGSKKLRFKLQR